MVVIKVYFSLLSTRPLRHIGYHVSVGDDVEERGLSSWPYVQ